MTNGTSGRALRIESVGHAFFSVIMIAIGIIAAIAPNFAPVWQPVAESVPGRTALIGLCAFISVACGIGLLLRRTAPVAARVLFFSFVLWLLVFRIPPMIREFAVNTWWSCAQTAVMVATTWVLYAWLATERDRKRFGFITSDRGVRGARDLYGLALIPFGLAHFLFLQVTADLVPGWLPGHVFWAYFTGAAFIVAGLAIVIDVYAKLAAALVTLEIALFTVVLWIPIVLKGTNEFQWGEFVVSWVLTATGWVMTDSYRGVPWLAVRSGGPRSA